MTDLSKEVFRKLIHLLEVPIIVGFSLLQFYFSRQIAILSLTGLLLLLLEIEYIRIDYQTHIGSQITNFFSKLLRRRERNNIISSIFFIISTIIAFSAFDYSIALLALLLTVFGDLTASIMGTAFGKKKIFRNKSYVGTIAGFIVNVIIGWIILPDYPTIFLPMAATASIVETLTQKLDDNLTVPLFAGFIGQLILFFFKIPLPSLF